MSLAAIQGIRGSYSEEATYKLLGDGADILECVDFESTFRAITRGDAEFAVVPVRNKIVGKIDASLSLVRTSRLRILDKLPLKVCHVLAGTADAGCDGLKTVRSHIEALKQCRRFLSENPQLTQIIGADTASSVRRIVEEGNRENAAIGSRRAAEMYGARILRENIADDADNWTTFYLLGN